MKKSVKLLIVIALSVIFQNQKIQALTILDADYSIEEYATITTFNEGRSLAMAFDDTGNLYVSFYGDPAQNNLNGSIYKVTPDKTTTKWVSNLTFPARMEWTGGTSFGNNLYVAENRTSQIIRIDQNGQKSTFATLPERPYSLTHNQSGSSANLYCGTSNYDSIYQISLDGQEQIFSNFLSTGNGHPIDLDFDLTGQYSNEMYVAFEDTTALPRNGIYAISPDGSYFKFLDGFMNIRAMEIDNTLEQQFGGKMFVHGKNNSSGKWGIWEVNPNGSFSQFINLYGGVVSQDPIQDMIFGPNGDMFVMQNSYTTGTNITHISRVSLVPEPMTMSLLAIGGLAVIRRVNFPPLSRQ